MSKIRKWFSDADDWFGGRYPALYVVFKFLLFLAICFAIIPLIKLLVGIWFFVFTVWPWMD